MLRFNKRVCVSRRYFGKWWLAYGVKEKVVDTARQSSENIFKGDIVSKVINDKLVVVKIKGIAPSRGLGGSYIFEIEGVEYIDSVEGWKKTEIVTVPLKLAKEGHPEVKWKGRWRLDESSLTYSVTPHSGGNIAKVRGIL